MTEEADILTNLDDLEHEIEYLYRNFPASGLDEISIAQDYEETLASLNNLAKKFSKEVRTLSAHHGAEKATTWKEKLVKIESDLGLYRREVRRRLSDLRGSAHAVDEAALLRSASLPSTASSGLDGSSHASIESRIARERKVTLAKAKSRLSTIKHDVSELNAEYSEHRDWSAAEDNEIESAMGKVDKWKEKLSKAKKATIELEGTVTGEDLTELTDELDRLKVLVDSATTELDLAVSSVKEADKEKGLYSDRKSKASPMQIPNFSGTLGEDFVEFQTKFEKAMIANKIPKADQLEKLREVLKGKAKAQVPMKTDDLDRAWDLLKSAFGDPVTLLKFRKQALSKLGSYPEHFTKSNPQKLVEWCLEIEHIIDDFIKLGDRETRLEMVAFNCDTINEIIDLFPVRLVFKMEKLDEEGRERLLAIQELVEEERKVLQKMAVRSLNTVKKVKAEDPQKSSHRSSTVQPKGVSLFNVPRKLPNCRICQELEKRGDNRDLYEAHQGNYATHCPRWAAMTNDERAEVAKAAKFCLLCMDPKVTFTPGNNGSKHKCITRQTKNRYSCKVDRCSFHSWVCTRHKEENRELFEKFTIELQKRKMVFTYLINMEDLPPPLPSSLSSPVNLSVPARKRNLEQPQRQSLDVNDAITKLQDLTPEGEHLVTKLKEPPLFMFSSTPGRYGDSQIFYDTGNSHVLFKTGTPENLYGVKTRDGPFALGAVGDTTVWGGDEWACQPMTTRGHREILIGVCVPKITSNFPRVNLREAAAEIKASAPNNRELQNLCVPDYVGGECHILLGIQYAAHYPRLVHSLESGLGIYEVKLKPSSSKCTAALAGPHHSFNLLAGKVGNVAFLLKKFQEGLSYWKSCGAPPPKSLSLSSEEINLAHSITRLDVAHCASEWIEEADLCEEKLLDTDLHAPITPNCPRSRLQTETRDDFLDQPEKESNCVLICSDCSEEYIPEVDTTISTGLSHNVSGNPLCILKEKDQISSITLPQGVDPEQAMLKHFISSQMSPLEINYRCPRCRACSSCKEAVATEKVSLREEAEEMEIRSSVRMDFKGKRFICKLPLRGKAEEFLCTNREIAEKVLEKQCLLYSKDPTTKELILKSMKKLFDNGHVGLLTDLPISLQEQITNEKVNYYIPWRVTFKAGSLSTPARIVYDCSSRTPRREDGSGGRCLNDICCKGKTMSFNLIKMLLRFSIGTHAISGDLRQFYNCFKLTELHWHLQLFLWKPDMDPQADTVTAVVKTLIYGNKSSAPQTEEGMRQLAERLKDSNPKLADFLTECRFVDDINSSEPSKEDCDALQQAADAELGLLGVESKGWGRTGEHPSDDIAEDGVMSVAGMSWRPNVDSLELKLGTLHFGKVSRGRLDPNAQTFDGKFATFKDMDTFVPQKLTKRMITSKFMGVFDLLGKLIPLTARMKKDLRKMIRATPTWDEAVSNEHRTVWVRNFLDIEKAKGLQFTRPRMPIDALNTKMRLLVLVDATEELLIVWAGVGFKRKCGSWSSSYLIGRSLLAATDLTIPRDELEALVAGSNMLWILRQILSGWTDTFLLAGDARIPLYWVLSDKKRLGLWHRTRSVQIRRGTPLENLFHVKTEFNVADGPTRPEKLDLSVDLGPGSKWEVGLPWMTKDLEDIVSEGILTPVSQLTLRDEEKKEYDEGFVIERSPDILTRGHLLTASYSCNKTPQNRVDLVASRAKFSSYLLLPTKFSFDKSVRIMAIVYKFCEAFKKKWQKGYSVKQQPPSRKFQVLLAPLSGEVICKDSSSDSNFCEDKPCPLNYH